MPNPGELASTVRPAWSPRPLSLVARYGLAAAIALGALLLRSLLPWRNLPAHLFSLPAVMVAATVGGLGPGLVATAASAAIAWRWILPGDGGRLAESDVAGLAVFMALGALVSAAARLHQRGRQRVSALERDAAVREAEGEGQRFRQEALRRYELLAAHGRDIILFVRADDGRILEANAAAAAAYGYRPEELRRLAIHELRPPETRPLIAAQMAEADAGGVLFETVHRRKDGSLFPVEVSSRGATLDGIRTLLSVIRDITERRQVEARLTAEKERLAEADRHKRDFLAMLSHELRNPLGSIRSSLQVIDDAPQGSAEAARAREVVHRQIGHLTRMVEDLLDVTRLSLGKLELRLERIDLRDVLHQAFDDHRGLFERKGVALRLELPDAPVWVHGDALRLAQVVGNLLHNAAKFTAGGGSAAVHLALEPTWAEFRVRDDGAGIPPGQAARMFEAFAQADDSLARTHGGLGLGLAIAKGVVERHRGCVTGRSEGLGRGSEFVVALPLASAPPAEAGASPTPAPKVAPLDVLIIEDYPDAGQALADVLAARGHRVRLTGDGRSGVAAARESLPDVVLCDIGLPDVDGYDVARAIRAGEHPPFLVALTGYARPEERKRALEAGFDAHVAKPVSLDELNALLGAVSGARGRAPPG